MEKLLAAHTMENLKDGSIVKGIVTKIGNNVVVVDIGGKSEGSIQVIEFNNVESIEVGREVDVYIDKLEDKFGNSKNKSRKQEYHSFSKKTDWRRATRKPKVLLDEIKVGDIWTSVVKNKADYGAFVDIGGLDGLLHVTDMIPMM